MQFPILDFQNNDLRRFIKQWSSFYNYDKMYLYNNNINKSKFTTDDLKELYKWKNGTPLSGNKDKSLETNILSKINEINKLKQNLDFDEFKLVFKKVSFVWRIFLLHIISPNEFPIYDQHIHRAYLFLLRNNSFKNIENTITEKVKEDFYFKTYFPFIKELRNNYSFSIQDLDKAFFTFGQFLKKYKIELENSLLSKS